MTYLVIDRVHRRGGLDRLETTGIGKSCDKVAECLLLPDARTNVLERGEEISLDRSTVVGGESNDSVDLFARLREESQTPLGDETTGGPGHDRDWLPGLRVEAADTVDGIFGAILKVLKHVVGRRNVAGRNG